ncbi:MAG TPA: DUF2141 domain-containing protein [Methylomirabilota bacterium]|nr:DUF2141 domain-containing protein [Methylomirabilota bacterium]
MMRAGRRMLRGAVPWGVAGSLLLALTPPSTSVEMKGEIQVRVVGLRSDDGELRWGLYNRKETFATKDGPIAKGARPIRNGQCAFAIADVPYGTYAIIVGHDVNRDGKISQNPFSSELKGMTNHSGKILSFPDFDQAKFRLDRAHLAVEIRVY